MKTESRFGPQVSDLAREPRKNPFGEDCLLRLKDLLRTLHQTLKQLRIGTHRPDHRQILRRLLSPNSTIALGLLGRDPTREVYKENGATCLSARTHVSLYDGPVASPESKTVNIDLKANNPPFEHFRKDFEKLIREGGVGVRFHLLLRLFSLISLLVLIAASALAGSDLKRPLTEKDLLQLLSGGVYSRRVAALVGERGLAFSPTRSDLESLRHAGADEFLLKTVAKAPVRSLDNRNPQLNKLQPQKKIEVHREQLPSSTAHTNAQILEVLPSGKITLQNWRQYQQYMPLGMIKLFDGTYFWKMPVDIEIDVGSTVEEEPPTAYLRATEKYSDRAKVVHLSNGHNDVVDYVAGEPFPNPHDPDKGYKLLADLWYAYTPHIAFGGPDNPVNTCTQDRLGNISCVKFSYVYRQTAYNTDPGAFHDRVAGGSVWYTEWLMIEEPEQARYTTQLTLFFKDNQQVEELYTFVPSLRQTIRGSLASRCSPVAGTDYIQDDYKSVGFNGGIAIFDAKFLAHKKILSLAGDYRPLAGDFPNNYYMPLGWPRPSWGKWQLRDVDVISVQRIPAEQANYCYGKRIVYEDSQSHYALWEDAYDSSMNLWKLALVAQRQVRSTSLGYIFGPVTSSVWDLQADHMTNVSTQNKLGGDMLTDDDVPARYRDLVAYSTPAGLYGILK